MKMAHAPPGHHSVVGRPSVGGLAYPEYVVYRGEQVSEFTKKFGRKCFSNFFFFPLQAYPEYLICYQIMKNDSSTDAVDIQN